MSVAVALKSVAAPCWQFKGTKRFMFFISIQELETAINYWRSQSPAEGEELHLCLEAAALAKPYALMIVQGAQRVAVDVLDESAQKAFERYQKQILLSRDRK